MQLQFTIGSSLDEVGPAVERIVSFCVENAVGKEVLEEMTQKIELSATEAITNIVKHAHVPSAIGTIDIVVERARHCIVLTLLDKGREIPGGIEQRGVGFDLGEDVEHLPVSGMGWYLIKSDMDRVEYNRLDGVNRLVLTKCW
jgi:serine/threonine-protein kinase RsbW